MSTWHGTVESAITASYLTEHGKSLETAIDDISYHCTRHSD
jgi:hypothetical protein